MKKFLFTFLSLITYFESLSAHENTIDDEKCQSQLNLFSEALANREFWAIQLFDTWAKIQAGFLAGNTLNLGNYDHCVRFRYDTQSSGIIQGQHCYVQFQAKTNSSLGEGHDGFDWREL